MYIYIYIYILLIPEDPEFQCLRNHELHTNKHTNVFRTMNQICNVLSQINKHELIDKYESMYSLSYYFKRTYSYYYQLLHIQNHVIIISILILFTLISNYEFIDRSLIVFASSPAVRSADSQALFA